MNTQQQLREILTAWGARAFLGEPSGISKEEALAQLEQLMVLERIDELEQLNTNRHYGKDYQDSLDELDEYKSKRIATLTKAVKGE